MVTIHDLTWEDNRLLDLFLMMDRRDQGKLMTQASVAVCYAVAQRAAIAEGRVVDGTPQSITLKALWKCAPPFPGWWPPAPGFEWEVEETVKSRLGDGAIQMILTTEDHDQENAEILLDWANEHAQRISSDFCAPDFEDGCGEASGMRGFIESWRESFMTNLMRAEVRKVERN